MPPRSSSLFGGDVAEGDGALPAFLSDDQEGTGEEDADEPAVIAAE